jgi:hypothetical protein
MKKFTFAVAAAIGATNVMPAAALTAANPAPIRLAVEATSRVENVACLRYGWRGYGLYPGWFCGPYVAPPAYPVYAGPYYAPAPVYTPPPRCWINGRWRVC